MIKDKLIEDFLSFSLEANTRSTVHIQDGLKPVHRRVLYDMATLSKATKDYVGSAKIVGDTLGQFHPHGDSSVYNAAVRLAQPFKTRYPLINFYGNYGSIAQPSGWAHQRYTKMKLSPMGLELLEGIDKNTIEMTETYNGEGYEPLTLPGLVPIALLNGTLGIGVGMASSLPPHNLREIMTATEYLVKNPTATTKQLMNYIKGPDFPTGGQIINPESMESAYETGRGSVKIRSEYEIVNNKRGTSIIINGVPYLVDPEERIIKPILAMHEEGYEYIEDIINHTGKGHPFKLEILLKKEAPVYQVLEKLHKETGIESSYTINNTVYLGNNKFKCLSLKEMLEYYINNSISILKRSAKFDLEKALSRLEIVEGLIIAIADIEEVIKAIRSSANASAALNTLLSKWNFSERQAKAILDMKLSRLTNLDESKLKNEKIDLLAKIDDLKDFISSKIRQQDKFISITKNFIKKYGDGRRTKIQNDTDIAEGEVKDINIFITEEGNIFSLEELPLNRRNTKGKKFPITVAAKQLKATDTVYIACENGTLNPFDAMNLYTGSEESQLDGKELMRSKPIDILQWSDKDYIVTLSKNGKIKKTLTSEYKENKINSLCKLQDSDTLLKVWFANNDDILVAITPKKKYIAFKVEDIKQTGRNTQGTNVLAENPLSIDLVIDEILVWGEEGKGKRIKVKNLQFANRRSSGLVITNATGVVGIEEGQKILVQGSDTKSIFIDSSNVSAAQPSATGVAILNGEIIKISQL